jgi:hypothetical protein
MDAYANKRVTTNEQAAKSFYKLMHCLGFNQTTATDLWF